MDALVDNADVVEEALARQIRPLVDRDLTVAFYDLTPVRIHGEGRVEDDIRAYGMNKETGGVATQFVPGVVQSADGLSLMHTVSRRLSALDDTGARILDYVASVAVLSRIEAEIESGNFVDMEADYKPFSTAKVTTHLWTVIPGVYNCI